MQTTGRRVLIFCATLTVTPISLLFSATLYTGDGILTDRLETERWHLNRTRYAPEQEADRFLLVNTSAGGTPNYDVAEDTNAPNDFGTTTSAWAAWRTTFQPLAPNSRLNTASGKHSKDLARVLYLTHTTPTGSPYYAVGSDGIDRGDAEGYTNSVFGFYENLQFGGRASSVSYPAEGLSPEGVHSNLFIDRNVDNRGHRMAHLNGAAREIGLGFSRTNVPIFQGQSFFWTLDFDTQLFGNEGSNHFFTDTIFFDANSNGFYGAGEGRPGVEIFLTYGTNHSGWYDSSQTSGNFAVPLNDIPGGSEVLVSLLNAGGSNTQLTIPFSYLTHAGLVLTNGESAPVGFFRQPSCAGCYSNVGFRNLIPFVEYTAIASTGSAFQVGMETMLRMRYITEYKDHLTNSAWTRLSTNQAMQETMSVIDPVAITQRFYRTVIDIDKYRF